MKKVKILVVEDEHTVAMLIQDMLKFLGYAVVAVASSGKEAIKKVAETHPDLILMDIMLEGDIDGVQAAEQIRAQFDIPVIYLTGCADARMTEPYGYILKPFKVEELHATIEIALYKHKTDKALRKAHDELEKRVEERTADLAKANEVLQTEITEHKRTEEALRKSEERFRRILASSPDAITVTDLNGNIIECNQATLEIHGFTAKEELIGKNAFDLIAPKDRQKAAANFLVKKFDQKKAENIEKVLEQDSVKNVEYTLLTKDGCEFPGELSASVIRDPSGNPISFVAITKNITERKQAEEALRKSLEREAQAYAQGRLEIVDTILHNVGNAINNVTIGIGTIQETLANSKLTHRLLSLGNAIKEHIENFADYIKNDPQGQKVVPFIIALTDDFMKQDEELAKIVSRVRKRAEHIADIIRTERTLGKRSGYRKDINLRKAIDDAITVLQDSIGKRSIEIHVDCDTAPKEISTQESQFHQMFVNLLKNSIEAIDARVEANTGVPLNKGGKGGCVYACRGESLWMPFIKVRCYFSKASPPGSDSLILEVTDNGIGIEKDKLSVIFRPGYTTKESGSGLGLHSIANFVNGCGGQILALSDGIGKGTMIRVALPIFSIT